MQTHFGVYFQLRLTNRSRPICIFLKFYDLRFSLEFCLAVKMPLNKVLTLHQKELFLKSLNTVRSFVQSNGANENIYRALAHLEIMVITKRF